MNLPYMSRRTSVRDMSPGTPDIPWWVPIFTDWGRPLAAVVVLVLCAPGEQHLAYLAGWNGDRAWLSWGWAGLLSLYAGISAVVATVRPRGTKGKVTAVLGAILSLLLAMAAQPVSHMFTTGWLSAEPRPPLWLVVIVSGIPPFILGHLLHLAASPVRRDVPEPAGQAPPRPALVPDKAPDNVSVLKPRTSRPAAVPSLSPVPAPVSVSLSKGTLSVPSGGTSRPSMASRALSLLQDGTPEDKVSEILRTEFTSPDGTVPKTNTIGKSIRRAKDKLSRP